MFSVLHQLKSHFQERLDAGEKMGLEVQSSVAAEIWVIGWDNWSGLFIMAWDTDGDRIVREIEGFIEI